jgi:hypothetical protein
VQAVTHQWCNITTLDSSLFPYHDDYVALIWVSWRKAKQDEKASIRQRMFGHQDLLSE